MKLLTQLLEIFPNSGCLLKNSDDQFIHIKISIDLEISQSPKPHNIQWILTYLSFISIILLLLFVHGLPSFKNDGADWFWTNLNPILFLFFIFQPLVNFSRDLTQSKLYNIIWIYSYVSMSPELVANSIDSYNWLWNNMIWFYEEFNFKRVRVQFNQIILLPDSRSSWSWLVVLIKQDLKFRSRSLLFLQNFNRS
jgi:hypothetical protein